MMINLYNYLDLMNSWMSVQYIANARIQLHITRTLMYTHFYKQ